MRSTSLANRVAVFVLIVVVSITLAFNLVRAYFEFEEELSADRQAVNQAVERSSSLLADAIRDGDEATISQVVDGLLLNKTIEAMVVEDAAGQIILERSVSVSLPSTPILSLLLPDAPFDQSIELVSVSSQLTSDAKPSGRLHLTINHKRGLLRFAERTRQYFWISVFRTLLLLTALILVLRYLLIRPLQRVVLDLQSWGDEDSQLAVPTSHEFDELGILVREINQSLGLQRSQMAVIKENEQRLKSILDGAGDACILFAQGDGEIVFANEAASELLGYSHEELLERQVFDISRSLDRSEWYERVRIVSQIRAHQRESVLISKSGDEIPVESTSSSIDLEGRSLLLSFIRDMSVRKRLESNLAHAQKLTAIGELTGGVAHDFNNLLQLIQGALENLKGASSLTTAEAQTSLDIADRAAEQGADLIAQLLAFSRKQGLDSKLIDLSEAIRQNLSLLRQAAGSRVSVSFDSTLIDARVRLDIGALNSALLNLVVNARHAMPEGGTLTVRLGPVNGIDLVSHLPAELRAQKMVLLSVEDDGQGMTEAVAQRIFEPFYTTKEQGQGTGMGLAMVFGFVTQSGGHIQVQSELGQGTTFWLFLPISEIDDLNDSPAQQVDSLKIAQDKKLTDVLAATDGVLGPSHSLPEDSEQAAPDTQGLSKPHVLLVDDHDDVRFITRTFLESEGFPTTDVSGPTDAIRILSSGVHPVQIVVSDLKMPEQEDGLDFIGFCQREYPDLAVVVISGDLRALSRAGAGLPDHMPVLSKPFTRSALTTLLQPIVVEIEL